MYRGRLERDFALWVSQGLIERDRAERLMAELDSRPSRFSVGGTLALLAATLVGAAILLIVATNWQDIPRTARLGSLVLLLWICHGGAALLFARGLRIPGAALLVVGTLSFGGAISLVGQMYHLGGTTLSVFMVWFAVAVLSAAAFRSGAVTGIAALLAWATFTHLSIEYFGEPDGFRLALIPVMAAATVALVRYTGADRVRHLAYLLLIAWAGWIYVETEETFIAVAMAVVGALCFLLATVPGSPLRRLAMETGAAPAFYTLLLCLTGLAALNIEYWDEGAGRAIVGVIILGVTVAALGLAGRDNGAVRYLAYVTFAVELLYLAFATIGTIMDTSLLFLSSGVIVALVAFAVIRLEKALAARKEQAA